MRAVDKAYQVVRRGIVAGQYAPNSRITEQEVAAAAGVSRTPAREALRRLHAEGLLTFTPNVGAVVASWTPEDVAEIFELRLLLEVHAAERAARLITDATIAEMRDCAERQLSETRARAEGHLERIGQLNARFHESLLGAANSQRLTLALTSLIEVPLVMKTFRRYSAESLERSALHHLELCQALEARDSQWAASVMRSHLLAAKTVVCRP
jgi:DNA-binding GntR family transcriptional regulator